MKIQINTDKTIHRDEKHRDIFSSQIEKALDIYQSHVTRVDVHLSDQNGKKQGWDDILCLLEASLDGRQPIVVSNQANTIEIAVSGAIDKLKAALESVLGRIQNHHR